MRRPSLLRVAVIEPVGGHGGMDYYDFGLCDGLARAGADVVLYTSTETPEPLSKEFICRRSFKNIFGTDPAWLRGLRYVFSLLTTLLNSFVEGRTICHFHFFNVGWLQLITISLARLSLRRVVVTAHDVECLLVSLDVPVLNRLAYRIPHRVIAHNEISRQELIHRLGLSPNKIDVIPHGNYLQTAASLPPQEEARSHLGISRDANVLLFFGQIKEVKGLDVLLRAMPTIITQYPDAVLLIAGRAWRTDFSNYQSMIDNLHIEDHCISHIRYINNDEVALYYAACDMVVLPYRRIYQSGVLLMAMSYAKPVLVSDIPGMLEVVTNAETGFVFRNDDAIDLAHRVCQILAEPEKTNRVAARGLDLMKKEYDWTVIGKKTLVTYCAGTSKSV